VRRIATCVALAACSSPADERRGPEATACPALEATAGDQPLPPLAHGLARAIRRGDRVTYEVHVFDRPGATCPQLLAKSPRAAPPGEVSMRAFVGGTGRGIAIDAWTQTGGTISLVGQPPKQAGDTVTLCVRERFAFEPGIGAYRNKRISVRGAFTGSYCGVLEM
jgi:hypothetical protein